MQQAGKPFTGTLDKLGTKFPGPDNVHPTRSSWNHLESKMAPRPSGFPWLRQSEPFMGWNPATCWRYIPKQKRRDPGTLIYLNINKKFAKTPIVFCFKIHLSWTQVSLSLSGGVSVGRWGWQERGDVARPSDRQLRVGGGHAVVTYLLCTFISLAG